ncbi:putative Phosphogluconate dehydrogenase NAD-binding putative C-terminal domain-containing protein [Seiridium cardinale]
MKPTIAVISIGEMGLGIARLLKAHDYRVVSNVSDRSNATKARVTAHAIEAIPSDVELVEEADYVLSIVPPRDALSTAQRIRAAVVASPRISSGGKALSFLDLNAVSPQTARQVANVFRDTTGVCFVDGVISGGVPHEREPTSEDSKGSASWHCPTLLLCGPEHVQDTELVSVLHMEHMSEKIGAATAVKMCFGMTTKGFVALAIQSFTTAYRLGVLDELQEYLGRYKPATLEAAQDGLVRMPHTAYRWYFEMLEMGETASEYGGFDKTLFEGVAECYRIVSEDTILGSELPDARIRGKTVEDVVKLISEGIDANKSKESDHANGDPIP